MSRKARRHIVKVRMPESSRSEGGKPSATATEARKSTADTRSAIGLSSNPLEERAKGKKQQGRGGGDTGAAAVAVKVCGCIPFPRFNTIIGCRDTYVLQLHRSTILCMW